MVRAFVWNKSSGNINIKSFTDLLNALRNSSLDELRINLVDNKRFLIKWLDEGFTKKIELINLLKEVSDVNKLRDLLVQKLYLLTEK